MEQRKIEQLLAVLYLLSGILSIITLGSTLTPWIHWSEILDTCPNYRCGCILYGESGLTSFHGGRNIFCRFAAFASIPIIIISFSLACYHGYRACITLNRRRQGKNNQYRRTRSRDVPEPPPTEQSSGFTCWGILVCLSGLVAALLFSNAVIDTDGYYKSCSEYRKTLVTTISATGNSAKVVYDRLSCGAIFDFMDYIEPTTRPFRVRDDTKYNLFKDERAFYRGGYINTGLALKISIGCLWINFIIWITITTYNFILIRSTGKYCST